MPKLNIICNQYAKDLGQLKRAGYSHEKETAHRYQLAKKTLYHAYNAFLEEKQEETTYEWFFNQLVSEGAYCEIMICVVAQQVLKITEINERESVRNIIIDKISRLCHQWHTDIHLALQFAVLEYVKMELEEEKPIFKKTIDLLLELGANPCYENKQFFEDKYIFSVYGYYDYLTKNNAVCYLFLAKEMNEEVVGILKQFIQYANSVNEDYSDILWYRLFRIHGYNGISLIQKPLFKLFEAVYPEKLRKLLTQEKDKVLNHVLNNYDDVDILALRYLYFQYQLDFSYRLLAVWFRYAYCSLKDDRSLQFYLKHFPDQLSQFIHTNSDQIIHKIKTYMESSQDTDKINIPIENLLYLNQTFQVDIARYRDNDKPILFDIARYYYNDKSLLYNAQQAKKSVNSFYETRLQLILKFILGQQIFKNNNSVESFSKELKTLIDLIHKRVPETAFDVYFNLVHNVAPALLKKSSHQVENQIYTAISSGLTDNNPLSCAVRRELKMQRYACSFFLGTRKNNDDSVKPSSVYTFTHHPNYHKHLMMKIFDYLDDSPLKKTKEAKSDREIYEVESKALR